MHMTLLRDEQRRHYWGILTAVRLKIFRAVKSIVQHMPKLIKDWYSTVEDVEGWRCVSSPVQTEHCWMSHVASVCTPCCMLLDVVACCCAKFETGQTFQSTTLNISFVRWLPKRNATMLDPFAQLFQHCCGHARSSRMVYKDLWVVSFPRCTTGPKIVESCCISLHHCQHARNNSQHCWELLRPFARSLRRKV